MKACESGACTACRFSANLNTHEVNFMNAGTRWRQMWLGVAAALLASAGAYAGTVSATARTLDHYERFAGDPVSSFFLRDFRNWELLDREHLLVHANPREAWLISVRPHCRGLNEAWRVDIGEAGSRIYANSGIVRFDSGSCRIDTIRKVDMRQARNGRPAPAGAG
ncbi:MAG: hypothetical protein H4O13_09740 [Xanthomonadales bacterium]|nr:hypothetical protein [Xanthomonadales bacterium]